MINKKSMRWCLVAGLWGAGSVWADQSNKWSTVSDALAVGLPALAGAVSYTQGDSEGIKQLALSEVFTVAGSGALKGLVDAPRPNGADNRSFPSRHTAVAFSAATYMDRRYGEELGSWRPVLYGVAGLVGLGRVEAKEHRLIDVVAGAALGYGLTSLWTGPSQTRRLVVVPTPGGLGMTWHQTF